MIDNFKQPINISNYKYLQVSYDSCVVKSKQPRCYSHLGQGAISIYTKLELATRKQVEMSLIQ